MKKAQNSVIIIGNGIAGITLATRLRQKSDCPITVVSDEHPYFFSRTALMYVYMGHLPWDQLEPYARSYWSDHKIDLLQERIVGLNSTEKTLACASGKTLRYDRLVIATGSVPKRLDCPGAEAQGVQGLYHKQDLDQLEECTPHLKTAVVVGGGLIGVELAEMLQSRGIAVHFLIREYEFWDGVLPQEEAQLIGQHLEAHGVTLHRQTQVAQIEKDDQNKVEAVLTQNGERIPCQWVGITIGVQPNIACFKDSGLDLDCGILVDEYLATNLPDVYALGDCAQLKNPPKDRNALEAVWYNGRMMGETLGETLGGNPQTYQPGPWFNSAKFFDIEYQTYGRVSAQPTATENHWYWHHPDKNCAFRIAYTTHSRGFLGVHALGIRLRHQPFHDWLLQGADVDQVMEELLHAHFDPEFSTRHLETIQKNFFQNNLQTQ